MTVPSDGSGEVAGAGLGLQAHAARALTALRARGWTLSTAESLTGGLVCAALTDVAGSSDVVRGGVVSYASQVKASVLGVDSELLATRGAVDAEVAAQMAEGVCRVLGSHVGVATTGVAGPAPADGQPVGRVYLAVSLPGVLGRGSAAADASRSGTDGERRTVVRELSLSGSRAEIRGATVMAAVALLADLLD